MRKADIVSMLCERVGFSREESSEMVERILAEMKESLAKGETIKLPGFGVFAVRQKNERKGRNIKTGQAVRIAPRRVVRFKASPQLKKAIAAL